MKITRYTMKRISRVSAALMLLCCHWVSASAFPKPKILSAAVEAKWIQTVKRHHTKDGATVSEVLAYAETMRPREFKAGGFDIGYNGATGAADMVTVDYWIGEKRLSGDAFVDLGYHMSPDGDVMAVPSEEETSAAMEGGRDAFLCAVDETYRATCRPDPDDSPSC